MLTRKKIWMACALTAVVPMLGEAAERFTKTLPVPGQPLVQDKQSGLMWQGCAAGRSGDTCGSGSTDSLSWQSALGYCEDLVWGGHADWRLPDIKELRTIVDDKRFDPSIDLVAFPETPAGWFWSSSSYVASTASAWYVDFVGGFARVFSGTKDVPSKVRCVRNGP